MFVVVCQDLTSVQNLQKKHALLEADVSSRQVRGVCCYPVTRHLYLSGSSYKLFDNILFRKVGLQLYSSITRLNESIVFNTVHVYARYNSNKFTQQQVHSTVNSKQGQSVPSGHSPMQHRLTNHK